jgi:hypothetical protein
MKMMRGDIQGAVIYLTERDKDIVLFPNYTNKKSGDLVVERFLSPSILILRLRTLLVLYRPTPWSLTPMTLMLLKT